MIHMQKTTVYVTRDGYGKDEREDTIRRRMKSCLAKGMRDMVGNEAGEEEGRLDV